MTYYESLQVCNDLLTAQNLLRQAAKHAKSAPKTTERIRAALSSVDGAIRNAETRRERLRPRHLTPKRNTA